eukprot:PhM_4_TR12527/c0_g1_i1/m.99750
MSLEARTRQAEEAVAVLRERVAALEGGNPSAAANSSLSTSSSGVVSLDVLKQIKSAVEADRAEAQVVEAKYKEAMEENAQLKQKIAKLEYRIQHLVKDAFPADKVIPVDKH